MDFVPPQFVIVQCRLTVPRVSHLIDLINSWSMNSIEYDQGVVVNRDLFWIPGSLEPIAPVNGGGGDNGGGFGGGGGGFGGGGGGGGGGFGGGGGGGGGGNNQQNDQQNNEQALGGDAVVPDVVDVVYDGGNETGQNFLNKRKRKMEQTTIQKKLKMKQE